MAQYMSAHHMNISFLQTFNHTVVAGDNTSLSMDIKDILEITINCSHHLVIHPNTTEWMEHVAIPTLSFFGLIGNLITVLSIAKLKSKVKNRRWVSEDDNILSLGHLPSKSVGSVCLRCRVPHSGPCRQECECCKGFCVRFVDVRGEGGGLNMILACVVLLW